MDMLWCFYRHGRLTECFESAGGNASAATFIIVDESLRGKGLGRQLMEFLEEETKRLGYHYLYLWTKTAIPFYRKIGYRECQRVSLKRACLKALKDSQVETLEAVLFRKTQQQHHQTHHQKQGPPKNQRETVLLPPTSAGDDDTAPDIWLRKRLVEHVGSRQLPLSERLVELKEFIANHDVETMCWRYFLLSVPWQAQVGPSCGLAALRMVYEYNLLDHGSKSNSSNGKNPDIDHQIQRPSLLGEAQERGYTQDGEVFNANHLLTLAKDVCGLFGEISSPKTVSPQQICQTLLEGGVFVLPYDSNPRTRLPAFLSGKHAHYGIIVGILVGRKFDAKFDAIVSRNDPMLEPLDDITEFGSWEDESVYALVQHSLSPKLSIAPWSEFVSSNQQLDRVDDKKFQVLDMDLKDRIILLRGLLPDSFG